MVYTPNKYNIYRIGDYRWKNGRIEKRIPFTPFFRTIMRSRFPYMKGMMIVNRFAGIKLQEAQRDFPSF